MKTEDSAEWSGLCESGGEEGGGGGRRNGWRCYTLEGGFVYEALGGWGHQAWAFLDGSLVAEDFSVVCLEGCSC